VSTLKSAALAVLTVALFAVLAGPAAARDRNHDRIPDRWEKRHHLSLHVKQAGRDQDRDHLRNRAEFRSGHDPRDRDSDDDGVMDGEENAGTIATFDTATGRLVINLFGGDTVSGIVNGDTRIECDEDEDHSQASASHEDEDHSGPGGGEDNSGPGSGEDNSSPEGGEDNSGPGSENSGRDDEDEDEPGEHEQGEDHPGDEDEACTTAALVKDAVVEEAELELANGVATFEEVELAR